MRYYLIILSFIFFLLAGTSNTVSYATLPVSSSNTGAMRASLPFSMLPEHLTAASIRRMTGKRLTLKQKIALSILRHKLKKQHRAADETKDPGKPAFILALIGLICVFIPGLNIVSLPLAIIAIVKANKVKKADPDNRNARRAIVMGFVTVSIFLLAMLILGVILSFSMFKV